MLTTLNQPLPTRPMDFDLSARRARNDRKLKSIFEHIFDKYEKDFSSVGDEIDLSTGQIVVNNGHLQSLNDERDPGDLSDTDVLNSDDINGDGSDELSPPKPRDIIEQTPESPEDAGFVISAVERRVTYTSSRQPQGASGESHRRDGLVKELQSSIPQSSVSAHRPSSDDRFIEPRWRAPRLPIDDIPVQEAPSTDAFDFQDELMLPSSPFNQSIWATPRSGSKRGSKRKFESAGFPFARPKRRKIALRTSDQFATLTVRPGVSSDVAEDQLQAHAPNIRRSTPSQEYRSISHAQTMEEESFLDPVRAYKAWTSQEDELLIALKQASLQGRKLYTQAFPDRRYGTIHSHWTWLRRNHPEKIRNRRQYSIPEHLRALNSNRGSPKYKSSRMRAEIAARKRLPSKLNRGQQMSEEHSESSESSALALRDNNGLPVAGQASYIDSLQPDVGGEKKLPILGKETELRRAVIPDSQEDEDLELLDLAGSDDIGGKSTSVAVAGEQPVVIAEAAPDDLGMTEDISQARVIIDLTNEPDDAYGGPSDGPSDGNRAVETICEHSQSPVIDYSHPDDFASEPLRSSAAPAMYFEDRAKSQNASAQRVDGSSPFPVSSPTLLKAIPNSSTDTEIGPSSSKDTGGVSGCICPSPDDLEVCIASRQDNDNRSSKLKGTEELAEPEPQRTPTKISLAPKKTWKKPKRRSSAKRKSDSAVAAMRALHLDSEDELAGTAARMHALPGSTIKAAKSRDWEKLSKWRRKSR